MNDTTALLVPAKGDLSSEARKALKSLANDRQRAFVWEYLIDYNATQAAQRAGYVRDNTDVTGPRLLGHVGIQAALREVAKAQVAQAIEKTRGTTLDRLEVLEQDAAIARTTPFDFIERAYGQQLVFKNPDEIPDMAKRAVKKVKAGNGIIEIEMEPKHASLQRLAQHHRVIGPGSWIGDGEEKQAVGELTDAEEAHATAVWLRETAARAGATTIEELALALEAATDDDDDMIEEAEYIEIEKRDGE